MEAVTKTAEKAPPWPPAWPSYRHQDSTEARLQVRVGSADRSSVPTLLATLIASLTAWLIDGLLRPLTGASAATAANLVVGVASFYLAKRFVSNLRGES